MFAGLKQPHVNDVSRKKATEELESTRAVAEAAAPGITCKMVKKSTGNFQKRSADVSSSTLPLVGFCSI